MPDDKIPAAVGTRAACGLNGAEIRREVRLVFDPGVMCQYILTLPRDQRSFNFY